MSDRPPVMPASPAPEDAQTAKSPDAFRSISEAAVQLGVPQHVLRFWGTRFVQVKPVKGSGGRRYYRPADLALLGGIRHFLYEEGYTIRGVQKLIRDRGLRFVAAHGEGGDGKLAASKDKSEAKEVKEAKEAESAGLDPVLRGQLEILLKRLEELGAALKRYGEAA